MYCTPSYSVAAARKFNFNVLNHLMNTSTFISDAPSIILGHPIACSTHIRSFDVCSSLISIYIMRQLKKLLISKNEADHMSGPYVKQKIFSFSVKVS